jgi:hypothetical protein
MKAANTSTTASVFGANRKISTATPRAAYTSESSDFIRQRPTAQPIARLPTMLNRPTMPSAHAPTDGGSWHAATTPAGAWR